MKLSYWAYMGPAHIGTLRISSSFKNAHALMHAPLGDDYFDVMRGMLERDREFSPGTTSVVNRHVLAEGSKSKVIDMIVKEDRLKQPDLIVLTPTCTSSILQEDLGTYVERASEQTSCKVILADVNHYRVNEHQAADRTLQQIIELFTSGANRAETQAAPKTSHPTVNIIGALSLGFHHSHDLAELTRLLDRLGIGVNMVVPDATDVHDLKYLTRAWFNLVPYRETGGLAAKYLHREFGMLYVDHPPIGLTATGEFIREIMSVLSKVPDSWWVNDEPAAQTNTIQSGHNDSTPASYADFYSALVTAHDRFMSDALWFENSVDMQNLVGKRAVVYGDSTHASCIARALADMGVCVVAAGTYCRQDAEWFRNSTSQFVTEVFVTDDHTQVAHTIERLSPDAIFGTQMERHIGKRHGIPCGVISAPVHIQNFALSYRPFIGHEGVNNIADLVYNSFTLGMEDHLLEIFGGHDVDTSTAQPQGHHDAMTMAWSPDACTVIEQMPPFARERAIKFIEQYAKDHQEAEVTGDLVRDAHESFLKSK